MNERYRVMHFHRILYTTVIAVLAGTVSNAADPPRAADDPRVESVRRRAADLIRQLDSDQFEVRLRASCRLQGMAAQSDVKPVLAKLFESALISPTTSLEVRKQLEQLCRNLPEVAPATSLEVSTEEIDRLIRQLEDNSYSVRLGATKRLEWMLDTPTLVSAVFLRLQGRLADEHLSTDVRRWLEPIYDRAWGAWLLGDSKGESSPPLSADQINRWIDELVMTSARSAAATRHSGLTAQRALRWALAQEENVPLVKKGLEARLARPGAPSAEATDRLQELLDLTRPAMVAEFWEGHQHTGTQYLLVGVPATNPAGISHFDRVDDRTAHCVSGVNLSPGDYPVGVAFPHPYQEGAFFHLVNLPTPRRRMAYPYDLKQGEPARLRRLTERTLQYLLVRKKSLSEPELVMLDQLDAGEVSRWSGGLFQSIKDQPLAMQGPRRTGGRPSHHGMLCAVLAYNGTHEAIPGLLRAIDEHRFQPPTPDAPYHLPLIAALAIAQRDPWPEVEPWLATLLARPQPLVESKSPSPELPATAAAMLLKRHGRDPSEFGLEPVEETLFSDIGVPGFRAASVDSLTKVKQWWEERGKGDGVTR